MSEHAVAAERDRLREALQALDVYLIGEGYPQASIPRQRIRAALTGAETMRSAEQLTPEEARALLATRDPGRAHLYGMWEAWQSGTKKLRHTAES